MATIQEQIAQARAAGYDDAAIAAHLSNTPDLGPKMKTALGAGYKPADILSHLTGERAAPAAPATPSEIPAQRRPRLTLQEIASLAKPEVLSMLPKTGQQAMAFVRPTVEGAAAAGGGVLGAVGGPLGSVAGAGLGYAAGKGVMDIVEQALGYRRPPATFAEGVTTGTKDVLLGATMEAGGRGVVAPIVAKGAEYVSKVRNIKADAYLAAIENKGSEIINALRGKSSAVPGAAPSAGEVAAPAGSALFSALQARSMKVPGVASEYADMAARSNQARLAQEARVADRFKAATDKIQTKIDSGLTTVSQRETGQALLEAAKAEKNAVKTSVIEPAYTKAFDAAGSAKIDVADVITQAESILGRKLSDFAPGTAPATVRKLLSLQPATPAAQPVGTGLVSSKVKGPTPTAAPPEVTLAQLDDVRKAINADIASAAQSSDPLAATTLRNLRKVHQTIDDAVNNSDALPQQAKDLYREALDTYRTQYAPRFKEGVNANLFKQTALNEPKLNPDDVVKTYFQPKGEREAGQFVKMFGQNPDAMKVARAGIEDLYRREVTDASGRVAADAHARFVKKYADPLRILDNAGMNVTTRLQSVADDAARLAKVEDLAKASGNKLAPPLPPGSNALVVQKRIDSLTAGMTPQQLSHIDAVRTDLLRQMEFERLAKAGGASMDTTALATEAGKKAGLPLPSLLSMPITVFNAVYKKLALRMDDKLALEIARELTSPALAANAITKAMQVQAGRSATNAMIKTVIPAAALGTGVAAQQPQNALAP
jgi:hypothetical protein